MATPLLTRLYTQEDFARYTAFFALATIFGVAAGGKYQPAIMLPKRHADANRLFSLSVYLTIIYSVLLGLVAALVYLLKVSTDNVMYYIPVYVLFFGIWSSLSNLSIRHKTFRINAVAKVLQSVGYIFTAVLIGLGTMVSLGLVFAKIAGIAISCFYLFKKSYLKFKRVKFIKLIKVGKRYQDFPKYGILPALFNTISAQALILILTKYYTEEDLGDYGLTYMVLSAPLGLIGVSYKDVFYQKMADLIKSNRHRESLNFFINSALLLVSIGSIIAAILILSGPDLFSFVFGESWRRAGVFAGILALSFLVKLVASPLSSIFNATNKLRMASVWQVGYFITTFVTLLTGAVVFELNITQLLYLYVAHEVILYSLYFLLEYYLLFQLRKSTRP